MATNNAKKNGSKRPTPALRAAHRRLESSLVLDVVEEALSAASGTRSYGFENIKGVGISEKLVNGWLTSDQCITVYVAAKAPLGEIQENARVPEKIGNVATDVVEIGEIDAFPFKGIYRPAPGGVSVGHFKITAGTVGCLVKKNGDPVFILSNNHVLANVNQGQVGDAILQAGPADGGKDPANRIAQLTTCIQIDFTKPNFVDCAIAEAQPKLVAALNKVLGKLTLPVIPAELNMLVSKCGRTTQLTRGRITDVNATMRVGYGTSGTAIFQKQIIIQSLDSNQFSQGGDSGSIIVNESNQPVALLFAGSPSHTIANPIETVLAKLGVNIVI